MISIIAALDEKRGIGKDNDLLFKIPEDFERMKKLTMGHALIMGRRTFDSIGKPLSNRLSIVLSRNINKQEEGLLRKKDSPMYYVTDWDHAISLAQEWENQRSKGSEEIFIFGGGQIFKEAIEKNLVDRLYLTLVEGDYGADTFFPEYSEFNKVLKEENGQSRSTSSGQAGEYKYKFLDLEKF